MRFLIFFLPLFVALLGSASLHATHNRGGEILFHKTGPLDVQAEIITYTRAASVAADRDSLVICWGDGTCETVVRVNGNGEGELITPLIKRNIYIASHSYASAGTYRISMTDQNRNGGIINVNPPASDNVPFHIESTVSFLPEAAFSVSSPDLLEYPTDLAVVGQPFVHMLSAFDADGDSLAYELATPMQDSDNVVPNYTFPDHIMPGPANQLILEPTGKLVWDAPQIAGEYTIALRIKSYHNGQLVETTLRDMLIDVTLGPDHAPMIALNVPDNQVIDVEVGQPILIKMTASDPEPDQILEITVTSGLLSHFQPPTAVVTTSTTDNTGTASFQWMPTADQVRQQPYAVVFKVKDNFGGQFSGPSTPDHGDGGGLADFKVVLFRVHQTLAAKTPAEPAVALHIFPNPAVDGSITVDWGIPLPAGARLLCFDALGHSVRSINLPFGATQQQLDVTAWPAGIYFTGVEAAGVATRWMKWAK